MGYYQANNYPDNLFMILSLLDKIIDLGEQKHKSLCKNFYFFIKKTFLSKTPTFKNDNYLAI